ncbi:hypothetical protein AMAG_17357 [Allomyces macrogynus ATCC 38327]|uniref:Transcription factor Iwr1 domain-containing protein n=1 Tax=Allomyces macrogynus (strain ATCC 38327) TaxID=578462 RepID=A0A0L0TEZ5_ALLM3|nr:hypothetical protein AMAG_17357 [Allomyces macrogynus ATCC 38327]|eukprot:KNE73159.1 hypothetical protein AMAG_17357 [Allomyces macrogynus ATCC 38327]
MPPTTAAPSPAPAAAAGASPTVGIPGPDATAPMLRVKRKRREEPQDVLVMAPRTADQDLGTAAKRARVRQVVYRRARTESTSATLVPPRRPPTPSAVAQPPTAVAPRVYHLASAVAGEWGGGRTWTSLGIPRVRRAAEVQPTAANPDVHLDMDGFMAMLHQYLHVTDPHAAAELAGTATTATTPPTAAAAPTRTAPEVDDDDDEYVYDYYYADASSATDPSPTSTVLKLSYDVTDLVDDLPTTGRVIVLGTDYTDANSGRLVDPVAAEAILAAAAGGNNAHDGNDSDDDSNAESYYGNDYPDEEDAWWSEGEEGDGGFGGDEDEEEGDEWEREDDAWHRPSGFGPTRRVVPAAGRNGAGRGWPWMREEDEDED